MRGQGSLANLHAKHQLKAFYANSSSLINELSAQRRMASLTSLLTTELHTLCPLSRTLACFHRRRKFSSCLYVWRTSWMLVYLTNTQSTVRMQLAGNGQQGSPQMKSQVLACQDILGGDNHLPQLSFWRVYILWYLEYRFLNDIFRTWQREKIV